MPRAPQNRTDAGNEFAGIERLGQIIIGSHFEADHAIDRVAFRRQHQNRHGAAVAAQSPANRQAVLSRQHQIEDHQFGGGSCENGVEVCAALRLLDTVAFARQQTTTRRRISSSSSTTAIRASALGSMAHW
jgi:hypothetical protein